MDPTIVYTWLSSFFDDQFIALFIATGGLFLIMLITWWVYKTLSKRNILKLTHVGAHQITADDHIWYFLKYFLFFPILTFIGFLLFALSLFLMIKPVDVATQGKTIFVAIVIISTIRVSAYINESLSEDLAKLIPLSVLSVVLVHPSFNFGITSDQFITFAKLMPGFLKYLVFTFVLEILLRGFTWIFSNLNTELNPD